MVEREGCDRMSASDRKVALVTGASRNIGRAIALSLSHDGYAVACFGRDKGALEETASAIRTSNGTASLHIGDAASDQAIEEYVAEAGARHGRIDVVVNNAGMMHEARAIDVTPADFRRVIDVNLTACFVLARAAHSRLKAHGGVVINIGSLFGASSLGSTVAYAASKAAVDGLTRALAVEWARDGIRVVCVAPGYVESDISKRALADPDLKKRVLSRIPQRRVGEPGEIGDLVAFLASAKARFITGETIYADGGQRVLA